MPIFVALLRGINVGKAKRVPMAEIKDILGRMGYGQVSTLLNSGNIVFNGRKAPSDAHAKAIAAALRDHFHFDVPVVVKSAEELGGIIRENALADAGSDPSRLLVVFSQSSSALAALKAIETLLGPSERFHLGLQGAFLSCAPSIHESRAGNALLGRMGEGHTTRNWATVLKLQALAGETMA